MTNGSQFDYLAGFFDAEGCVYFSGNQKQQQVMYSVGQHDPTVLYLFQGAFGGSVRKRKESTDKHRAQWIWMGTCVGSDKFCATMLDRTTIKHCQIRLAMEFASTLRSRKRGDSVEVGMVRGTIREKLSAAKGKDFDREVIVVPDMPVAYWAGLFDGDGTATVRKMGRCFYPKASLFSSYMPILECARRQFSGSVFENRSKRAREWRANTRIAEAFLRHVEPYVIVKANVVRTVLALGELAANSRGLMVCNAHGWDRRFPDSVILKMDSIAAHVRELNRFGPRRGVA